MTFEMLDAYLLGKKGATFDYPFDDEVRVYRIAEKMFALVVDTHPLRINLKCDFENELSQEIGQFDAEFLLAFFADEIGGYFYNKGLRDAQDIFKERVESITDAIYELEVATAFSGK